MEENQKTPLTHFWKNRKQKKTYQFFRFIIACYVIIFAVFLLKNLSRGVSLQEASKLFIYAKSAVGSISWGWFFSILLQSATVVAIFINNLLGRDLIGIDQAVYLMIGLLLGNSVTPLFASLFVKSESEKHWDIRHGFEIGLANIFYSILVASIALGLQITTGSYSNIALWLKSSLGEFSGLMYLPNFLNLLINPMFTLLNIEVWPFFLSLTLSFFLLVWGLRLFGDSILKYHGGYERSRQKIEKYLGSKWQTFLIGLLVSCFIPSSSLLITLLVPLSAKGILSLKQAIPFLVATNLVTFIDVLTVALVDGSAGAIAGALVLVQMSFIGVLFMNERFGICFIHKITRYCSLYFLPQKKLYIVLFLLVYTLIPLIISRF